MGTGKYIAEKNGGSALLHLTPNLKNTRSQTHTPTCLHGAVEINIRATSLYCSSILKMEAAVSSEMLTPAYKTTGILSHTTVTTLTTMNNLK